MAKRLVLNEVAVLGLRNLQEASSAGDMLHSNVRARLDDAIRDKFRNTGNYGYYLDHTGDGADGDVVYSCSGDTKKAPYHISNDSDGKASTVLDFDNAKDVVPVTSYQEEAPEEDAADHMAAMQEAKFYLADGLPVYERFISKGERDKADSSDFAGKGKSFPILKPEDVSAAASSLGRAGTGNLSMDAIKRRIISIAKRKGWTSSLPKSWQDDTSDATASAAKEAAKAKHAARGLKVAEAKKKTDPPMVECTDCDGSGDCPDCDGDGSVVMEAKGKKMKDCPTCKGTGDCQGCSGEGMVAKESASRSDSSPLKLVESTNWKDDTLSLIESAGGAQEIELKLIAPGKGSSAFYPAEVLKRDGPSVFTKNTQIYINHATSAEESQRPEGDWHKLAGALSTDAYWKESHPKGPGLYAKGLFTSDYAGLVREEAPFTGMSIRASGVAAQESGRTTIKEGVPVLAKLTHAESVDVVTRAGAGGMILTESQRDSNTSQGADIEMTEEQLTKLTESITAKVIAAVGDKNKPLIERAVKGDATRLMESELETVGLPAAQKQLVRETVFRFPLPLTGDFLDETKFIESVRDEAKRVGKAFAEATGGGRVYGMGPSTTEAPTEADLKEAERARQNAKDEDTESVAIFESLMGSGTQARAAALGHTQKAA